MGSCSCLWIQILCPCHCFSHLVIDVIKTYSPKGLWNFVIDQIVHWAILIIVTSSFDTTTKLPIQSMDYNGSFSIPLFILAILLCIKPANILIKLVLKNIKLEKHNPVKTSKCRSVNWKFRTNSYHHIRYPWAIWSNRFYHSGKIHTSIQRHGYSKTEYVLAGTFLSFGIALLCGLMVTK